MTGGIPRFPANESGALVFVNNQIKTSAPLCRHTRQPTSAPLTVHARATGRLQNTGRNRRLKLLTFGVEIELVCANSAARAAVRRGLNAAPRGRSGSVLDHKGRIWKVCRDYSIHECGESCEIISPPLRVSDLGLLADVVRELRTVGRVNGLCGVHVHVDGAPFKREGHPLENLIDTIRWGEPAMFRFARTYPCRRTFCKRRPQKRGKGWSLKDRYWGTNLRALVDHGTVEYRMFNGTLEPEEIEAFVLLALGTVNLARSKTRIEPQRPFTGTRASLDAMLTLIWGDDTYFATARRVLLDRALRP